MGNPLRNRDPGIYRIITLRTQGAHLWLRPSKDVNRIIGGVLARYAEILGIEIYAYIFLSNHYHLLIRCPNSNSDEFFENVNRELARRLNWKLHREGKFWGRRYSEQEVLTEEDLLEAFLYITTNGARHGLVENPKDWPGLSSYHQSTNEKPLTYAFHHYSSEDREKRTTYHTLKLTPLPQYSKLSKEERTLELKKLIDERASSISIERRANGFGFLGVEKVRAEDPHYKPVNVAKSPRPHCYTKDAALRRQFRRNERRRRDDYAEASMRFRLGDFLAQFPQYTYKPPLHRKPRLFPFTPLPDDFFKIAA